MRGALLLANKIYINLVSNKQTNRIKLKKTMGVNVLGADGEV